MAVNAIMIIISKHVTGLSGGNVVMHFRRACHSLGDNNPEFSSSKTRNSYAYEIDFHMEQVDTAISGGYKVLGDGWQFGRVEQSTVTSLFTSYNGLTRVLNSALIHLHISHIYILLNACSKIGTSPCIIGFTTSWDELNTH